MPTQFDFKEKYNIFDLVKIMQKLRGEDGCPWDAQQTHESIKKNFIEETYEVIEAINKKDAELLKEELGDVLLQIVFHSQMESEKGVFDFDDVADGICKKLIERHPHVFGSIEVSGVDDVLTNWDDIKRKSKKQKTVSSAIDSIPRELPALMRSTKIQQKAAKSGFDWDEASGAIDKLKEEIAEFEKAVENKDTDNIQEEIGDILFSAVNISRLNGVDAEEALTASSDKFAVRFSLVENLANERGIDMSDTSIDELDKLWEQAKAQLRS